MGIFDNGIPVDAFSRLEFLEVESCHGLRNIFSPSMVRGLTGLKRLKLNDCKKLQEVIAVEKDGEGQRNIRETLFAQLKELSLQTLPNMHRFCHMKNEIDLPSLEDLTIENCPLLESFTMASVDVATKFLFNEKV